MGASSMRAAVASLAALVLTSSGCVYYNTFYHARAAAREAEILRERRPPGSAPSAQELELLDRVVEKCGRVLRLHPDSSWADDASLLLATTLSQQGKHGSAVDRLSQFAATYPASDLLPRAEYALAEVLLASGNAVSAEDMLAETAFALPPSDLSDDALVLIGKARFSRARHEDAAQAYRDFLERFPQSRRRAEVRFLAAENEAAMGRLESAAAEYSRVADEPGGRELAFEARVRLAELSIELGAPAHAVEVLDELEPRAATDTDRDRVVLLRGRAHEAAGALDRAVATYEATAASRERTEAAAEALYRIGVVRRDHDRDLNAAAEAFAKAKEQAPQGDAAERAAAAASDIEALRRLLAVLASPGTAAEADTAASAAPDTAAHGAAAAPDTTAHARSEGRLPAAEFRAAEIYLLKFGDTEEALTRYGRVLDEYPDSEEAPKAALAMAWVYDDALGDRPSAEGAYRRVVERFPGTDYAAAAEEALARLSPGPVPAGGDDANGPKEAPDAGAE